VGVIDLVLAENAGPRVVDFKTAARNQTPLEISHELQLTAYAYLFRHNTSQEEAALEIRQPARWSECRYVSRRSRCAFLQATECCRCEFPPRKRGRCHEISSQETFSVALHKRYLGNRLGGNRDMKEIGPQDSMKA